MARHSTLTLLPLFLSLLLPGVATAGIWQPSSGGGGAAPITKTISGAIAAGASATGNTTDFFDVGSIFEVWFTSTASSCVDVEFFRKDTMLAADRVYYVYHADGLTSAWQDLVGTSYRDEDGTTELHWRITNCGAAISTVSLTVYGVGE
jgi:hypothetical protein